MTGWIDELAQRPVTEVARSLSYTVSQGTIAPCPACRADKRSRSDRRAPVGTISSDLGWKCHACQNTGNSVGFVALHMFRQLLAKGDRRWRELHEFVLAQGLVVDSTPHEDATTEAPRPPVRLPSAEVLAVWNQCVGVHQLADDDAVATFLGGRKYGPPSALAALEVVRAMPASLKTPWWWPEAWTRTWRLVTLAYEADGTVASMHARAVVDTDDGKTRWPKSQRTKDGPREAEVRELLFANPLGVKLLRGEGPGELIVVVGEGLTGLLNASLQLREKTIAVLTATSGGFSALRRVKWPAKCTVYVTTDDCDKDGTGERYARQILSCLPPHVTCKRVRWNPSGDGDRDLGNAGLNDFLDVFKKAGDMRSQDYQGPKNTKQQGAPNSPPPEVSVAVDELKQLLGKLEVAQDEREQRKLLGAWLEKGGVDAIRKAYRSEREAIDGLFTQLMGLKAIRKDIGAIAKRVRTRNKPDQPSSDERQSVEIELDMVAMTKRGLDLLNGHDNVFVHNGRIVQIGQNNVESVLRECGESGVLYALAESASWFTLVKNGDDVLEKDELPPQWLAKSILAQPVLPFRPVDGIARCPTLRPDGTVLMDAGYDAATRLFVDFPDGLNVHVPEEPALDDADAAIATLLDLVVDFPFEAPHHRSAWLSALLTLVARPAIEGCCPLFLFTASTPGSGKGLLADLIGIIALGGPLPKQAFSRNDEEFRKRITAIALGGAPTTMIDNVNVDLAGSALDSAITAGTWTDRELKTSAMVTMPLRTVFMATGNNVTVGGDMIRRTIPIHLVSELERPEERTGFRHPNVKAYARQHRGQLLSACLTILRAYVHQGRPRMKSPLGSFDDWSMLVRDALVWAGQPDPCDGIMQLRRDSDPKFVESSNLLAAWHAHFGDRPKTAAEVSRLLSGHIPSQTTIDGGPPTADVLYGALREDKKLWGHDGKLDTRELGTRLRSLRDRIFDGKKLVCAGISHKVVSWRVDVVSLPSGGVGGRAGGVEPQAPPDEEPLL